MNHLERRDNSQILEAISTLHTELTDRLARIETRQEVQQGRCDAHAVELKESKSRIIEVERAIEYKENDDNPISRRVGHLEGSQGNYHWLYAWIGAAWAALIYFGSWVFTHAENHQEAIRHGAAAIKKIKGGG